MKKTLTIFLLLLTLSSLTALEEATSTTDTQTSTSDSKLSALKGGLNDKTEDILEREIIIPSILQIPFRIILGIDAEIPITIERLVVLLATWIMFFTIIQGILRILPLFNGGNQVVLGSLIITILIAITGSMDKIVIYYFELGDSIEWISYLGPFQLIPAILISIILMAVGYFITHKMEKDYLLEKAKYAGQNANLVNQIGKKIKSTTTTD